MPRRSAGLLTLFVVTALAVTLVILLRQIPVPTPPPRAESDPRRTYAGPYRNVHPDVKYVGDAACIDCHRDIAKTYARHPMGRSMAPATAADDIVKFGPEAHNPFEKFGYHFRVEHRDGKTFHIEERRDAAGAVVAANECEAVYAVGSGTRGKTYLVKRGDFLFQSPISWYSEKGIWDIAPGYPDDRHFNRPIQARCLFCHCNHADAEDGPHNRYREPIFHGYAIGCERCHGPGGLHVKRQEENERYDRPDTTIVNPKRLEPRLRDSVCEQCHLQGEERVVRRGRDTFDFRPGMPLHDFWSVFARVPELNPSPRSVGQFEQMHLSRCYQATGGKLGCISCHDPHERPTAEKRVSFYRDRCMQCHQDRGCSVPAAERTRRQADDSCIACHMSKAGSSNIPHTAVTDHRVLRRPDTAKPAGPRPIQPGELPIVHFHRDAPGLDPHETSRDLGLALAGLVRRTTATPINLVRPAMPLLEDATQRFPNDARAWEALALMRSGSDRLTEALDAADKALAIHPRLEQTLVDAGSAAAALGNADAAIGYWDRAIAVNPWVANYHFELARLHAGRRDWEKAVAACDAAIRLEPVSVDARRTMRVTALIRLGEKEKASAEYETIVRLRPPNLPDLRRVFEPQLRP